MLSIIAILIALLSAAASVGLWRSARRANETANELASIEASRRYDEETPEFEIKIVRRSTAFDHADLEIKLTKPAQLDEVIIRILDEANVDHWACGLPDGVTREQADLFVWGPWEFNSGASQQVMDTRTSRPRRYSRVTGKDTEAFDLIKTRAGHWMGGTAQEGWEREHEGPVRLLLECRVEGRKSWHVRYDVSVPKADGDR